MNEIPVCDKCGSECITSDGLCTWSRERSDWCVLNVYDKGHYCNACLQECGINWIKEGDYEQNALARGQADSGGALESVCGTETTD